MDFHGQRLAEQLLMYIIIGCAAGSFVTGMALQNFKLMVQLNGVGLLVALLVVLPDWPFYNRKPANWLPPLYPKTEEAGAPAAPDKQK